MIVYAAMKCECVYESGLEVISLHTTKAGAYKVCRKWWLEQWSDWNDWFKLSGHHGMTSPKECRRDPRTATGSKRWAVKSLHVLTDKPTRGNYEQEGQRRTSATTDTQKFPR